MITSYPYTASDLLSQEPYHYHYTPYEGPSLLHAYRENRRQALARYEQHINELGTDGPFQAFLSGQENARPAEYTMASPVVGVRQRPVDTLEVLRAAAEWVVLGGAADDRDLMDLIDALVKKFEVSKRLRSRYGEGLCLVVRDSAPLDAYCYLGYLVSQCTGRSDDLWHLNALLKINDLVISSPSNPSTSFATAAALQGIRSELTMTEKFGGLRDGGQG